MKRLLFLLFIGPTNIQADEPVLPGPGFTASHYEALWTKSPFAVATPEIAEQAASSDYSMVGAAKFDGISYVNLIDKQTQEHFLLASDKPVKGLTLVSVTRDPVKAGVTALIQRNGQTLSLTMEAAAGGAPPPPMANNAHVPLPVPGGPPSASGNSANRMQIPPPALQRRPPAHVPRRPPETTPNSETPSENPKP